MPIIVACPTCSGQLRIADDLIGRRVRCPACNSTFEANDAAPTPAAPPPVQDLPVETERVPAWKHLDLDLAAGSSTSDKSTESAGDRNGGTPPKGAVEIEADRSPSPSPRSPSEPAQDERPDREKRRARRDEDNGGGDGDALPCPVCGAFVDRDATRCTSCRARLDQRRRSRRDEEDEDGDYPRRRQVRRDCESHRGSLILTFGIISAVSIMTSLCYGITTPIGIGFGIAAWIMGSGDLKKIRNGTMDPDGDGATKAGWICGIIGFFGNLVLLLACGTAIGFFFYMGMQESRQMRNQRINVPPPPKAVPQPKAPLNPRGGKGF